ncbi:phosphoglycerate dehydrogenase [Staphylococcus petrasii]|uniref:phosphoglycerate dehydrogenase n=1 Tax=Staphylococcus petrasii TaxID=1276936 RepID=UPI001F5A58B7|nr:phosphoglycerate dehydrogenase [Staphylococcus petrasii]MCI2775002.1 phosphoglycerate dehydrogenase [Staphylococcus petrasii]
MKIVSLKRLGDIEGELKNKYPDLEFSFFKKAEEIPEELKKELDILIGYSSGVDKAFIESCPNLKWITWYATGVNNLPLEYIKEREIILTNTRGVQAKQLAEFILAFILDDYKKMRTSYINQKEHKYDSTLTGRRLDGEKILFLGTGAIAQRAVKLLSPFDVEIVGVSKSGREKPGFTETYKIEDLDNVIGEADIIINSLPETQETYHLLNQSHFKKMKDEALFINVGRGTIVAQEDIVEVLKNKLIRHAYLDVFENEPLEADNPLYALDNVTITDHITGNDVNIKKDATEIFERNLYDFLNKNEVNENRVDLDKGY